MSSSLYAQLLKQAECDCNSKLIGAYVIVIKRTKSLRTQQEVKLRLFFCLSKLIIKAINNFNHLTKNVPKHKVLHSPEDIAMECYERYDACLQSVEMGSLKKFYFFLNTALNRAIYRIYEKQYKRYFNVVDNTDENSHLLTNAHYNQHIDFSEVDLMQFTEVELDILRFKVEGGKLNVFLKEHDMVGATFHKILEGIKEKLSVIYKEEDYFKRQELIEI